MITRYDPFREALSLRRAMDQLFEQSFVSPRGMPGSPSLMVPMDICETPKGYEVDVALPGVREGRNWEIPHVMLGDSLISDVDRAVMSVHHRLGRRFHLVDG